MRFRANLLASTGIQETKPSTNIDYLQTNIKVLMQSTEGMGIANFMSTVGCLYPKLYYNCSVMFQNMHANKTFPA